jgi:hypothetical protein
MEALRKPENCLDERDALQGDWLVLADENYTVLLILSCEPEY